MYSVSDSGGGNPLWTSIGYRPSSRPASAVARPASVTTVARPLSCSRRTSASSRSGAGGGRWAAAELAARGLRVVVLEAGPADQAPDFEQRELDAECSGSISTADSPRHVARRGRRHPRRRVPRRRHHTVNWQTSLRTPDFIRDEWSALVGMRSSSPRRASAVRSTRCGRGAPSRPMRSIVNANNRPLQRGCAALGYEWAPIARNSRGCDASPVRLLHLRLPRRSASSRRRRRSCSTRSGPAARRSSRGAQRTRAIDHPRTP